MAGGRKAETERRQRAEIARYLMSIYERAGYTSQAELARDVNVEPSRVSHWLKATGNGRGPSAHNLLLVIQAAERRKAGASTMSIDQPLADRLRALEEKVDTQGQATTSSVDALARDVRALTRRIERRDAPATGAGS